MQTSHARRPDASGAPAGAGRGAARGGPGVPRHMGLRTAQDAGMDPARENALEAEARAAEAQAAAGDPASLNPALGADAPPLRVRRDAGAARALGQTAFAYGDEIVVDDLPGDIPLPLLAHEATHLRQQRQAGTPFVQGDRGPVCGGPAPVTPIEPLVCPAAPPTVESPIDVAAPSVAGTPARPAERIVLHQPVTASTGVVLYALPRSALDADPDNEAAQACGPRPPLTALPATRADDRSSSSSAPAGPTWPGALPGPVSRAISAGGLRLEAVRITDAFVIVTQYHHLAVGAGALTILESPDGLRLIDAGVGQEGGSVLAEALLERASAIIGDRPILEVMVTHLHADHTAMLPALARRFAIGSLRVNALQFADPRFQLLLADIAREQAAGVPERARARFDADRSNWERSTGSRLGDAALRESSFAAAREQAVADALARLHDNPTRVELLVPQDGALHAVSAPIGEIALPTAVSTDPVLRPLRRPASGGGPAITDITDPRLGAEVAGQRSARAIDPAARVADTTVDAFATAQIIDLPGGNRLMVVPDARIADITPGRATGGGLLSQFEAELGRSGHPARFQVWNMTHHMQSGWAGSGAPHVVGNGELVRFIEMMQNLRQLQARQRAPGTAAPADVVMVSVLGDPGNPLARSLVNPGMVWFLRALGFETMLATTGRDLRVIEAMGAGGTRIEGVAGMPYEGGRPGDAILSQSEQARRFLEAEIARQSTRKATRGMSRADSSALVADREARLAALRGARDQLNQARDGYLEAVSRTLWRGPHDAARPSVAPAPGAPTPAAITAAEATLRTALASPELSGFAPEASGTVPRVSDAALVVMRVSDSAGGAATRRYMEIRGRLDSARTALEADAGNVALRSRMLADLQELQTVLQQMVETEPEATRGAFREELVHNQREMEALLRPAREGEAMFSREPRTGRLVESRVRATAPAPTAADHVRTGADAVGRAMGAVMVVQTIRSETALLDAAERGDSSAAQAVVGTTHNALGVTVGLRMATGFHVSPYEFVALSLLDISQTALTDHGSHEANVVAFSQSVVRNGLTLGLMVIGGAMMRAPNPYLVAAGFAVTMLTEPIMMGLEAAGVFDAIERASAFLPSEVTATTQELRDLMRDYRSLIGARRLAARSDDELRSLGAPDAAAVRGAARSDIADYDARLARQEADVLGAFDSAYSRARGEYAGLYELDQLREQFLQTRQQAHDGGGAVADEASRTRALARFGHIDEGLTLGSMSDESVHGMPQWSELRSAIAGVQARVADDVPDWEDLRDDQIHVEQMLRNARYRIDPAAFGLRSQPLMPAGTPARGVYEAELVPLELRWADVRRQVMQHATGLDVGNPHVCEIDPAAPVRRYLQAYRHKLDEAPSLPFTAAGLASNSTMLTRDYRNHVEAHGDLARYLLQLEAAERGLQSSLDGLTGSNAVSTGAPTLRGEVTSAISTRRALHGLYFLGELAAGAAASRAQEVAGLAPLFEAPAARTTPLSPEEQAALARGELEDLGLRLSTVTDRLQQVPDARLPANADERVPGLARVSHGQSFAPGIGFVAISETTPLIVGLTGGRRSDHDLITGGYTEVEVIAINDAALARFGPGPHYLRNPVLEPVLRRDLEAARPH